MPLSQAHIKEYVWNTRPCQTTILLCAWSVGCEGCMAVKAYDSRLLCQGCGMQACFATQGVDWEEVAPLIGV